MIYSLHPSCPFPALHSGNPWQRPHSHQATEWQTARTIWKRINHSVIERSNHSWKVCFFSIVMLHLICLERQMSLGLLHPNNFETKALYLFKHFQGTTVFKGDQWKSIVLHSERYPEKTSQISVWFWPRLQSVWALISGFSLWTD